MTAETDESLSAHFSSIDHIEFNVNDMEVMANFYKKAGFVETRRTGHTDGSIELRFPGGPDAPIMELNQSMNEPKGFQHLALRAKNIDAAFAAVQKSGLPLLRPLGPPLTSGRQVFNIKDPQGNKLQVATKIKDDTPEKTSETNQALGAHFLGIDHLEFNVDDMEAMADFFKKAGFIETRRTGHTDGSIELRFPGGLDAPIMELNQSMNEPKGFQHLALRTKDIEAAYAEAVKSGMKMLRPLGPPTSSGRRVFNFEDPQGNKLQVSTKID